MGNPAENRLFSVVETTDAVQEKQRASDKRTPPPPPRLVRPSEAKRRPVRVRHSHFHIFGRELSTPFLLLAAVEVLVLALAFLGATQMNLPAALAFTGQASTLQMALFVVIGMVGMVSMGLYRRGFRGGATAIVLRILAAGTLAIVMMSMLFYVFPPLMIAPTTMAVALGLAVPGILITRFGMLKVLSHEAFKRRVLVLGAGDTASLFQRLRRKSDQVAFTVVGFVPGQGDSSKVEADSLVDMDESLTDFTRRHHIDDVVIAYDDPRGGFPTDELMHCKMHGVNVLDVADFFEREAGLLKLDILRPSSMIFGRGFRQCIYRDYAKRVLDLVSSLGLLAITWPFMVACAIAIFIESKGRGSVIFKQVRTGQHGQPFTLFKFRSMIMDAEKDGKAIWAQQKDPRVTRFGHLMRKTRLDELPQLFNVIRGDMSFVGPRPERPEFVESLGAKLPYYHHRHWVKPGLTGWAQIHYPYGASEKDAFEKLKYDLYYVKNQSMALDILTIVQTVEVVLWGRGSR
ncbi:TIGR03013 family XrtA/PEP-CTERM system glycosyltransferase [Ectothiorhodospira sp. BSL-9]|uniref:TIGR03013 family XrtA/PEP-CTERM system glycosyltransferase n=1 Tax=Ectothiorhodospira sp. BSL-9 TaxID=1442136 RepID=UPI000AE368F9|nr:TIGR03013 family XrtA/PEP-CTERM system glycosyltransferase [Ectothiorhodospira sp. BSL-9]